MATQQGRDGGRGAAAVRAIGRRAARYAGLGVGLCVGLRHLLLCVAVAVPLAVWAEPSPDAARAASTQSTQPQVLPPDVHAAWQHTGLPPEALAVFVADAVPGGRVWWQHQGQQPFNPASTLKLVTTFAALDLLGPAHVWRTQVLTDAPVVDGVLAGPLYLRGGGDPKLVTERLWWLLRRVQALGIARVAGDIVLDRTAYRLAPTDPGAFDGEPLRPYNATADAWLVNFKTQQFQWEPDPVAGVARVSAEPPLAGVSVPPTVPLQATPDAVCGDWRVRLQADFSDPLRPVFRGPFPLACGPRSWPVAYPEPERFAERAVAGMWQTLGGRLDGVVREGQTPAGAALRLELESPPLADVVRDVNKFSNNVMAQHVLLALAQSDEGGATFEAAREVLAAWWVRRVGADLPVPQVGNGSGLSRDARLSAEALARLLQVAYASSTMPELMASLPVSGLDGTLRRSSLGAGVGHLKTGSLRDVQALAGYVHGPQGERRVLVALVNHPNARAARPALEALVQWAAALPPAR